MAAGGTIGVPTGAGITRQTPSYGLGLPPDLPMGDQRAMARKLMQQRGAGFSPGGMSDQNTGDMAALLQYLGNQSGGRQARPRARGFAGVQRR